jgi:hypothetical protein
VSTASPRERIKRNLHTLSRTLASGIVSTASTPGKAEMLASADATAANVRRMTEDNAAAALDLIEDLLANPRAPLDLRAVVERVNAIFTRGVLKTGSLYRTHDPSSEVPYLPAAAIPEYAASFYKTTERSPAPAAERAAYAIWGIDLRGHLFADGCGKTATVISGFILSRSGCTIPLYSSRDAYYAAPYGASGAMSWRAWRTYFISMTE